MLLVEKIYCTYRRQIFGDLYLKEHPNAREVAYGNYNCINCSNVTSGHSLAVLLLQFFFNSDIYYMSQRIKPRLSLYLSSLKWCFMSKTFYVHKQKEYVSVSVLAVGCPIRNVPYYRFLTLMFWVVRL